MAWISVRNWRKFQHYDPAKRAPKWVKVYAELMADDAFLDLTYHQRGVLLGIWLEYAAARCQLRDSTSTLSRRLGGRVTRQTLDALESAGFIDIVASKVLADGYQDASLEVEKRREEQPPPTPTVYLQRRRPHRRRLGRPRERAQGHTAMSGGGGGGFKLRGVPMTTHNDWASLRAHLIDTYGDTPRPETEAVIIQAYEAHPSALEHAAQSIAVDVTAGTIRSGWAVLRSRAGSITTPQANPTRATGIDREKRVARAKQWIHNAGIHFDDPDEVRDELARGLLRDYNGPADLALMDEILTLWAEERPTGLQLERDAIARAEAWKAAQHLMRQKPAAARADDDQPL